MPKIKSEWIIHKEAYNLVVKLCEMHPRHLGHLAPDMIGCVSIANKEKGETQPPSKIRGIRMPDALFSSVRYVIEFYQDIWEKYTPAQRAALIFKNLVRIPDSDDGPDGSILKQDLQDVRVLVKSFGVDYMDNPELPDLSASRQVLADD